MNEVKEREGRSDFEERVIHVNRCAKVVKGGRRFSFSALVVVGDRNGRVGFALGKANEVADAIRKGTEAAKRNTIRVAMKGKTIPHEVTSKFDGAAVFMRPASEGTGVIAGGGMRAVLELSGIRDVLAKSMGSTNPLNVIRATMIGLRQLSSREAIFEDRGITLAAK
ncbi:MAG TPA: 30S ribosomal protein S5 [Kiritimatiellia bacterium]|nr:30S ribosomal protein S5 [Kiritimatiellia bacterium]HMO98839.1 30S ribosomal protein S5 [Kiritimatiellia bacterium]HMP96213.1 30S ribosomal protein S5 [Kiritimatiellia bacterium]